MERTITITTMILGHGKIVTAKESERPENFNKWPEVIEFKRCYPDCTIRFEQDDTNYVLADGDDYGAILGITIL